jgi:PAS domain-containing protein
MAVVLARPAMVWQFDSAGQMVGASDTLLQFAGLPLDKLVGDQWRKKVFQDDELYLRLSRQQLGSVELEFRMLRHDGVYCWLHFFSDGVAASAVDTTQERIDYHAGKPTGCSRWKYGRQFILAWQTADSLQTVSHRLCMSTHQVRLQEDLFRKSGVPLKLFPERWN